MNADRGLDWIEIYNSGSSSVSLNGYTVRSAGDMSAIPAEDVAMFESALSGDVAAGAYLAVDVNLDIDTYERLFLVDAEGNVVSAHSFPDIDASTSYQTFRQAATNGTPLPQQAEARLTIQRAMMRL